MTEFNNKPVTDRDLLSIGLSEPEPVGGTFYWGDQKFDPNSHQAEIRRDLLAETGGEENEVYQVDKQQALQATQTQRLPGIHTAWRGITWESITRKR